MRSWRELHRRGAALGFDRFLRPVVRLADALTQKSHVLQWDWQPAAEAVTELTVLARLAQEGVSP